MDQVTKLCNPGSVITEEASWFAGERPYRCVIEGCSKSFRQLSSLQQHLKGHNLNNSPNQSLTTNVELKSSESPSTSNKDLVLPRPHDLTCQVCEKHCSSDQRFYRHMHKYHPDFWRVFSGGVPLSEFLETTSNNSAKDSPFLCSICNKRYIHKTGYMKHMTSHILPQKHPRSPEGMERSECSVCKRIFSKEAYLLRHLEMKTDSEHNAFLSEIRKIGFNQEFQAKFSDRPKPVWHDNSNPFIMCLPGAEEFKNFQYNQNGHYNISHPVPFNISPDQHKTDYMPSLVPTTSTDSLRPYPMSQDKIFCQTNSFLNPSARVDDKSFYQDSIFSPNRSEVSNGAESNSTYIHHQHGYFSHQSSFNVCKVGTYSLSDSLESNFNVQKHLTNSNISSPTNLFDPYFGRPSISQHDMASALQHLSRFTTFR
ncbi:hypothetical protein HELRODRAFT_181208 [Helobdella robusta]|uniref:C2H2-type domain-containing protein n=1 Tax=Helobdella robusta TaxID=6412 RepID=T1FGQ8_HELRO|nr:hypothetical protein HELRODRAFT_181208 [Helobdella robusta]ESN93263.1 hypothetical protein HELRODRAFT_181208 [Helobdella robusta]